MEEFKAPDGDIVRAGSGKCKPGEHYIKLPWTTGRRCQCGKRRMVIMLVDDKMNVEFAIERTEK